MNNETFTTVKTALLVATALDKPLADDFNLVHYVAAVVAAEPSFFAHVLKAESSTVEEVRDDCYDYLERHVFSCTDEQADILEEIAGTPIV